MAAALLTFVSLRNPNPNQSPNIYGIRPSVALSRLSPCCLQLETLPGRRQNLTESFLSRTCLGALPLTFDRRIRRIVPLAASHEESHSEIEVEKEKNELKREAKESQEAWKQTLESFKQEALKMKEMSQEAYEVYSEKAMVILKERSEALKVEADKARRDLNRIAKEISEEGKVYLSTAAENSPDSVKDIVETFSSSTDELKEVSKVRDFYLGIPYGAFLAVGGFLSFMLTGSICAIRFGVILGSILLALSISSLRSWKSGQSSELFLKGQAAIAAIIFLREFRLYFQSRAFSTFFMTLLSGGMLSFYVYRIMTNGSSKGPSPEQNPEN